jgi:hypothetical protein
MPFYVRESMESWEFAEAHAAMEELTEFVELRDAYEVEVAEYGFAFPDFQDQYEVVEGPEAITEMGSFIEERQAAIVAYDEARQAVAAPRDLAMTIGLNELPEPGLTLLEAHRCVARRSGAHR